MLRILTAGESHGKGLVGIIEGLPSNLAIDIEEVNKDLARRQRGYGRGGRMSIEMDTIEIIAGMRGGKTLGSPLAFMIENRDFENWRQYMDPIGENSDERKVTKARPGHADLTGVQKYNFTDVRNVLERSSARETALRVAAGSIIKQLMAVFGIKVASHVTSIGAVAIGAPADFSQLLKADASEVRCIEAAAEAEMIAAIKAAKEAGDSLGGTFEVQLMGVPVGLGSYVQWDRKLDARLAYQLMSIQAIKGVELGDGFENSKKPGSEVHDEIYYSPENGYYRNTNRAGGVEGGMSNGEIIVIRCAMKPIPTLYKPLKTVDIESLEAVEASVERSDSCAVPAASVVGEMVAISVIAEEFLRKFGGDSVEEIYKRWKDYI